MPTDHDWHLHAADLAAFGVVRTDPQLELRQVASADLLVNAIRSLHLPDGE